HPGLTAPLRRRLIDSRGPARIDQAAAGVCVMRMGWFSLGCLALLTVSERTWAQTYWLGRQPDPKKPDYVFDVRVPADLAAIITCSSPKYAKFRPGVLRFQQEVEG